MFATWEFCEACETRKNILATKNQRDLSEDEAPTSSSFADFGDPKFNRWAARAFFEACIILLWDSWAKKSEWISFRCGWQDHIVKEWIGMVGSIVFQFFSRTIQDLKCTFPSGGWKVLQLWPSKNLKILSHEYEASVSSKQKVVSFESLGTYGEGELQAKVRPWPKEDNHWRMVSLWWSRGGCIFCWKKQLWFSQLGRRYKNIILLKALMISSLVFPPNTHTELIYLDL